MNGLMWDLTLTTETHERAEHLRADWRPLRRLRRRTAGLHLRQARHVRTRSPRPLPQSRWGLPGSEAWPTAR